MKERRIIVCSGPSGVGKSTVLKRVLEQTPEAYFSVSATTRAPRPTDQEGVTYYFVSHDDFAGLIVRNELWEYNQYANDFYGTPAAPLENALAEGKTVFLDVEPNGAFAIRRHRPDATLIYIAAPSMAEVRRRLEARGDTPPEKIKARLERAGWENQQAGRYDYIAINDDLDTCVSELLAIIRGDGIAENYTAQKRKSVLKEEL